MARKFLVFFLFTAMAGLPGMSTEKMRILASILPFQEFASAIVGDRGEALLLLPPGASVHNWQLRPGDVFHFESCDVFIFAGADLEPWVPDVLKSIPRRTFEVLEASHDLSLIEAEEHGTETHDHGSYDPHFWLDFELDIQVVDRIEAVLTSLDPEGKEQFRENARALKDRLRNLDGFFLKALKDCPGRDIVIAGHGAFGYLARRYGLIQKTVYGLSPDSLPRPGQLIELIDFCRANNIRAIYFENSVSPDVARVLAREIGARVLTLYAGHNLTEDQIKKGIGFFDLMEENLKNLKEGLSGR